VQAVLAGGTAVSRPSRVEGQQKPAGCNALMDTAAIALTAELALLTSRELISHDAIVQSGLRLCCVEHCSFSVAGHALDSWWYCNNNCCCNN
jgi:hypothetical protein